MDVRPIESEADYDWAFAEVEAYFRSEPPLGSPDVARFSVLSTLIRAYEDANWPIESPTAIEGIRAVMELTGRSQADLARLLGERASLDLLSELCPLTMEQARMLASAWSIPADILLQPLPQLA